MKRYFSIKEFCKLNGLSVELPITPGLADKVLNFHLFPLNDIRTTLGMPIHIRSGYRPVWFEKTKGRDGDSQHCYRAKGATDCSLEKHSEANNKPPGDWAHFFKLLKESPYKRIAYYPDKRFFHLDYKSETRQYFINKQGWHSIGANELVRLISNQNRKDNET